MNPNLFRARARQVSRRNATFGGLPRNGTGTAVRSVIGFGLLLLLILLLGFVPIPDRVLLSGYLYQPKPLTETAATAGQIQSFAVQVGDLVDPGGVIAYLDPLPTPALKADPLNQINFQARASLREHQIKQQQQTLLIGKIIGEISTLIQQQHWQKTLINLETEHLKQQQHAIKSAQALFRSRFISAVEWQRMNEPLRTLATRIVHLRADQAGLSFRLLSARANLTSAKLDVQRAEIRAQRQRQESIEQQTQSQHTQRRTIAATSPGRVTQRSVEPGDFVTPGTPLIQLTTNNQYYLAKLRIPTRIQTALGIGDRLELKLLTHLTPMDGSITGVVRDLSPVSASDPNLTSNRPADLIATVILPKPIVTSTGKSLDFVAGAHAQSWLVISEKTLIERLAVMIAPEFGARFAQR